MDSSTYMNHTPVILNTVARLINPFLETTLIIDFKSRNYFDYLKKLLHSLLLNIQALYDYILSKENPFTCTSSKVSLQLS